MSLLPCFHLPPVLCKHVAAGPNALPLNLCLDLHTHTPDEFEGAGSSRGHTPDNAESPATLRSKGSFNWDREKGRFDLEWANLAEFETWRQEEHIYSIELFASTSAKINISYSILFNLTTSYSSYFEGKKGISRNKTSFFLLMHQPGWWCSLEWVPARCLQA